MSRIVISGLKGGSGKTLLSLGLAASLVRRGRSVKPYKKGPDYIDAAWLALAAKYPCTNLDPLFLTGERLRQFYSHTLPQGYTALIEGNRGLFDGRDISGTCSTAELAKLLSAPVLLSMDCTKMTRTAAAIVYGMTHFDADLPLSGVILNNVGTSRQERVLREAIEQYTDVPVLGALPRLKKNPMPERHMGLASQQMDARSEELFEQLAVLVEEHTDIQRICSIADAAPLLAPSAPFYAQADSAPAYDGKRVRIGYVRDDSLWFYYEENLEELLRNGAELVRLSLSDPNPWPELDGLYLGGGFPEDNASVLKDSLHLREIRQYSENGMPVYAECGGFMVLCKAIAGSDAHSYPMAGVFDTATCFNRLPQGLGYIEGTVTEDNPFFENGSHLTGHEFHYSQSVPEPGADLRYALSLSSGTGMGSGRDALVTRNTWGSFTHIFAPAIPQWARNFVAAARSYSAGRQP